MLQFRKIRISFFICFFIVMILAVIACAVVWPVSSSRNPVKKADQDIRSSIEQIAQTPDQSPADQQEPAVASQPLLESSAAILPEYYYLRNNGDFLAVYQGNSTEYLFETDLKLSDLPFALQEKIDTGLSFATMQELYSFLENYSS